MQPNQHAATPARSFVGEWLREHRVCRSPPNASFAARPAAEIVPGQVVVKLRHAPALRSEPRSEPGGGRRLPATVLPGLTENSFVLSYTGADEAET